MDFTFVSTVVARLESKEGESLKASIGKCLCHGNLRDSQDIDIVGLKSYMDAQYSSEIGIGTPLPPSNNGKFVDIHYGTGAISGFFSQDNVKVGALVVKN
ncbi:hypothetical protein VitviT2T_005139 [Vitis vinifera]|uniref:Peptidase A1 domain-containing protein n=1 Tax=Vitis vinifera TaxID=29760 RepID=A0ABY9BSA7_VITVI|nr:hypothetical protein VitviT2T_005139 [Vitis vinifera]